MFFSSRYSDSQGVPSESGIQLDSKAALKYIFEERKDIKKSKIFIHGRSLGGAVTIYAATHTNFNVNFFHHNFSIFNDRLQE